MKNGKEAAEFKDKFGPSGGGDFGKKGKDGKKSSKREKMGKRKK